MNARPDEARVRAVAERTAARAEALGMVPGGATWDAVVIALTAAQTLRWVLGEAEYPFTADDAAHEQQVADYERALYRSGGDPVDEPDWDDLSDIQRAYWLTRIAHGGDED